MRYLQELVPGCSKVTGKAGMLDEIINYVQSLQKQVEVPTDRPAAGQLHLLGFFQLAKASAVARSLTGASPCLQFLSMKIAASNPVVSFDIVEDLFGRQLKQAAALPAMALPAGQLEPSCLQMSPMQQVHPSAAAGGSTGFGLEMVVNNLYAPAAASCPVSAAPSVSAAAGPSTIEPCLNVCT